MTFRRKRTAILISGRGSNMRALIDRAANPSFPAEIVLVLSNRPDAAGLAFAKENNIACAVVDHKIYAGREEFERSMQVLLELHRIELVCLAGFMRMLTPWFIGQWQGRLLNVHPALLPAYRGLDTHERALADGAKIHGCTVHFVVPAMDAGPIIAQAASRGTRFRYARLARRARACAGAYHLSSRARLRRRRPPAVKAIAFISANQRPSLPPLRFPFAE